MVKFVVAGVDDETNRRGDSETDAIGNAVGDMEWLNRERADLETLAGPERNEFHVLQAATFFQLAFD